MTSIIAATKSVSALVSAARSEASDPSEALGVIASELRAWGFAFVPGADVARLLSALAQSEWIAFAASWDDLGVDNYMADHGRYRRRRHAAFRITPEGIEPQPHRPHYQSRNHNPLNGGVLRWFDQVTPATSGSLLSEIMAICRSIFQRSEDGTVLCDSLVEMHQFRIEPGDSGAAKPTPEGMHRDGVDWVCVMLVDRLNVKQGITIVDRADGVRLGSFTLRDPFDAMFIDDRRVTHGVTPISRVDPARPAHRDVLVLTFDQAPDQIDQ